MMANKSILFSVALTLFVGFFSGAQASDSLADEYFNKFYQDCLDGVNKAESLQNAIKQYPDFGDLNCTCGINKLKTQYTADDIAFLSLNNGTTDAEKSRKDSLDNMAYTVGGDCVQEFLKTHPINNN